MELGFEIQAGLDVPVDTSVACLSANRSFSASRRTVIRWSTPSGCRCHSLFPIVQSFFCRRCPLTENVPGALVLSTLRGLITGEAAAFSASGAAAAAPFSLVPDGALLYIGGGEAYKMVRWRLLI